MSGFSEVLVNRQYVEFTVVECPYCGAAPGQPCLTAGGLQTVYVHMRRMDVVQRRARGGAR